MPKNNRSRQTSSLSRRKNTHSQNQESESGGENALRNLFLDQLGDIYNAEQQLTKALPKMAKAAESSDLRDAFESHLSETNEHISRIEQVAEALGQSVRRSTCQAMRGLVEEAQEMLNDNKDTAAIDAALIAASQKVEHYEIATYGTLCSWAEQLGENHASDLLRETLDEEKAADDKLTTVAEGLANERATSE